MNSAYLSRLCLTSPSRWTSRVVVFARLDSALRGAEPFSSFLHSRCSTARITDFLVLLLRAGKARRASCEGLERPPNCVGHGYGQRKGVAPAQPGVLPASKLIVAPCATSMLLTSSRHRQGAAKGYGQGDVRLSCTRHLAERPHRVENGDSSRDRCRRKLCGRA